MPAAIFTEPEAKAHARPVIVGVGIGTIRIWPVIVGRRRGIGTWGIRTGRRRRTITIGRVARTLAAHAGIISRGIVPLHVAGRGLRIGGTDCGAGQKARTRADRGARAGMTGGAADDGAQSRTTQSAADGAIGLRIAGGLTRG